MRLLLTHAHARAAAALACAVLVCSTRHAPSAAFLRKMSGDPHTRLGRARRASAGASNTTTTFRLTEFGGDPAGRKDSVAAFDAILKAVWAKRLHHPPHNFTDGPDLGGCVIDLEGGQYGISRPIVFPAPGGGNIDFVDGSIRALPAFGPVNNKNKSAFLLRFDGPRTASVNRTGPDWYCADMGPGGFGGCQWYTYIRFENLVLDAGMRGGYGTTCSWTPVAQ